MDNIIKNSTACNDLNDKIHFQIRFRIQPYYALIEIAYFCYKNITKETFQNKICSDSELYYYGEDMLKPFNQYHILKLFYCMRNFFIATFNDT